MKINAIISALEAWAAPSLQESYDNSGLLTGSPDWECTGILVSLDVTEEVVQEAASRGCNLVVAHHPIIFGGLKRLTGRTYVERTVIAAIKRDLAIYAIHTNLDNVLSGVNGKMASLLGLTNCAVLAPKENCFRKLVTFCPHAQTAEVRSALFAAGAGHIGQYSECSFNSEGTGTFKAGEEAHPFVGQRGQLHEEPETKIEVVFPSWRQAGVLTALREAHPYEEVAYDILPLGNTFDQVGSGLLGELPEPLEESRFLDLLKSRFQVPLIRHTQPTGRPVKRVALCGGAGSFLISRALSAGADAYVTADVKYHEFFDADNRLLLTDIGHFESEQFTIELIQEFLEQKFPTFAVLKTGVRTNPVHYS